jgi:hypothetical protein
VSNLVYLYGFVPRGELGAPTLPGIAGQPVELVEVGAVKAAVSRVPAASFAPELVEERVHDLDWLSEQGALHERVVTWFADHAEILPVRLLTLYSGADALAASLRDGGRGLAKRLGQLAGLREWDLKVRYDARILSDHLGEVSEEIARLDREAAAASPGRRYLIERRRAEMVKDETGRAARLLADTLHEQMSGMSRDSRTMPPPKDTVDLPMVLNAAYLVPRDIEQEMHRAAAAELERLRALGLDGQLTGPWAPYRFLVDDSDEAGADDA